METGIEPFEQHLVVLMLRSHLRGKGRIGGELVVRVFCRRRGASLKLQKEKERVALQFVFHDQEHEGIWIDVSGLHFPVETELNLVRSQFVAR